MRKKNRKAPIMLNLRGGVVLKAVDEKLCRCCQRSRRTKTYYFSNAETNWSRQWCKKCVKLWKAKNANLATSIVATSIHLMAIPSLPWWKKALKKTEACFMSVKKTMKRTKL